jgi:hypothetical protein
VIDPEAGPEVSAVGVVLDNQKIQADVRFVEPGYWMGALCRGRRWAWEPIVLDRPAMKLGDDMVLQSQEFRLESVRGLAFKTVGRALGSLSAFEEYEQAFLPQALAVEPFRTRPDYVENFEKSGWHHKVGYYLMVEVLFRSALIKGASVVQIFARAKPFLDALKQGLVPRDTWHGEYDSWSAEVKKRLGPGLGGADPSLVRELSFELSKLGS